MTVWDDLVGQDEAVAVLRKAAAAARAIVSGQDVAARCNDACLAVHGSTRIRPIGGCARAGGRPAM